MLKRKIFQSRLRQYTTLQLQEHFNQKLSVPQEDFHKACQELNLSVLNLPTFQKNVIIQPEKLTKELEELMNMDLLRSTTQKNQTRFAELAEEIKKLEDVKLPIDQKIDNQIKRWKYYSIIYLTIQAAALAHMTWIDFGWDIVEPISYAVTFTVVIWGMAYYSMFKHDYTFSDAVKRIKMSKQYVKYGKVNFDIDKYNAVVEEHQKLQKEIERALKLLGEK